MADDTAFPMFVVAEYQRESNGFPAFEADARASADRARKHFEASFTEIGKIISTSLTRGVKTSGAVDLGVPGMQQAAREARAYAESVDAVSTAASNLARRVGDTSVETQTYLAALRAQVIEARAAAKAADEQAASYGRLQGELDRTASRTSTLVSSMRALYQAQAEAARDEVRQNARRADFDTALSQGGVGPRSGKSASDSAAVFAEALAIQDLAKAERDAAIAGDLLATINRNVGVTATDAARSAAQSASVFEAAFRVQEKEAREAAQAWEQLARAQEEAERQAASYRQTLASQSAFSPSKDVEEFQRALADVQRLASSALSVERGSGNTLNIDPAQYRQAAIAAREQATALREIATAAERAAAATQDTSEETRRYILAAGAAARSADEVAQGAEHEAVAMERLQQELNLVRSATTRVIANEDNLRDSLFRGTDGLRAKRFALIQTGQQLQDFTVSLASGQNIAIVFAQQLPQLAFSMQGFGGKVGKAAEILSGPFGFAVFGAITAVGLLAPALIDAGSASLTMADQQKILADVVDKTTGKIREQITATQLLALAQDLDKSVDKQQEDIQRRKKNIISLVRLRTDTSPTIFDADSLSPAQALPVDPAAAKKLQDLTNQVERGAISWDAYGTAVAKVGKQYKSASGLAQDLVKLIGGRALSDDKDAGGLQQAQERLEKTKALLAVNQGVATEAQKRLLDIGQGEIKSRIEAVTDLAAATDRVSKAEANLRVVRLGEDEAIHKGGKALSDYQAKLQAAKDEISAARQAVKDHAAATREHNKEVRAATALATAQATAEERIAKIRERFDAAPRLVDQQESALRYLDSLIAKYGKLRDARSKAIVTEAKSAVGVVQTAVATPYNQTLRDLQDQLDIGEEIVKGHVDAAEALRMQQQLMRQLGVDSIEDLQTALERAGVEGDINQILTEQARALRAQGNVRRAQQDQARAYLAALDDIQRNIENTVAGLANGKLASVTNLAKGLERTFTDLLARSLTEKLFGDAFRELEDQINGIDPVKKAGIETAHALDKLTSAANDVVKAFGSMGPVGSTANAVDAASAFANDNVTAGGVSYSPAELSDEILVAAKKKQGTGPTAFMTSALQKLAKGVGISDAGAAKIGEFGGKAIKGAAVGAFTNSIFEPLAKGLGLKTSKTGAQIGGAIGGATGLPGGDIIGSIIGSVVGGLFKKTKFASASLGYDATTGQFTTAVGGNSDKYKAAAGQLGSGVTSAIQSIADALGGTVGDFAVSIGQRKKKYVVDPTGNGATKGGSTISFKTEEEAVRAALADAISDGVIQGVRAGTQKLLSNPGDIDVAVARAAKFEGVFSALKQAMDPVGYAIEQLDKQFVELKGIFAEAGASTEEYADLEKLYGLQRAAAVKQASAQMTSALKGLLDTLNTGDTSGLSLRDRLNNALATYNPLASRVAAGDSTVDYDAFTEAARTVQDLARQLYGSQDQFFSITDNIRTLTTKALGDQQALIDIATGKTTPFDASSSSSTTTTANDNAPVVSGLSAVEQAIANMNAATQANLAKLVTGISNLSASGNRTYSSAERQNF